MVSELRIHSCYLAQYNDAIQQGEITAGIELKMELSKLIRDMKNEKYQYDTKYAHMRIEFMENLCLQSKKPFYMQPLELLLWEKAFIECMYSFKKYSKDLNKWIRRFQDVLLLVARKNGKTTLMASDAHTDLRIGDGGQDIVCCSTDDKTASLIWNEINGMRKRIDPKSKWTHKNLSQIENKTNDTKIFKMSEKMGTKDGRNIDKTYYDESHEAKTDEVAMACWQSMGVKDEPLFINLTTNGFTNDGYLDKKLAYARQVLNDEIDDDTFLPWLYTQDSEQEVFQDENSWFKSNPSLGTVKKWAYLRGNVAKAKLDKSTRMHVLCKDFNIKQDNAEAWLMREDYCYVNTFDLEDFRGSICLGAVDLSETTDLTCAKILLMKPNDKTKYIHTMYWIPQSKLEKSDDSESGADYKEWAKKGLVRIHEENEIDLAKVADWFYELHKNYGIRLYMCGYDQRFSKDFLKQMDFYTLDCEMVLQNRLTLSNPMKYVEADLKAQLINYNDNEVDKWCFSNTSISVDDLGMALPVKIKSQPSRRIDGSVTLIILYEIYRRYKNDFNVMVG